MNILRNLFITLLVTFIVCAPVLLFAQGQTGGPPESQTGYTPTPTIENPIKTDTLNGLIKTILEGVIKIGIPIIALALVYCGFLFVQARGSTEKLNTAKKSLLYTLIGAAILLGAWAIAQLISETVLKL
jgi:hypothetical protein